MSTCIDFYLCHNNEFIPITDYGRNTKIFRIFNDAISCPYGKIRAITESDFNALDAEINKECSGCNENINNIKERITTITTMNNSVEQKLIAINDCEMDLRFYRDELEELERTRNFITFLYDMRLAIKYNSSSNDLPDNYIYVGVEIGHPTLADIV